jgi:multimeric flavodoxin WrbA
MSKIVAVTCSPSDKDSSSRIADAFLDGAMGLSTNIVTLHRPVKFKSINDCHRCMGCKSTGRCVLDDDIRTVLDDIKGADCVVFALPIHFNGPIALYKIIEDRMYSFLDANVKSILKPGIKAVLVITSTYKEGDLEGVASRLSKNLEMIGFEIMDTILYCDDEGKEPVSENQKVLDSAKEMGRKMRNTPVV